MEVSQAIKESRSKGATFEVNTGKADLSITACWGRILKFK
jgi:hypothetical protein